MLNKLPPRHGARWVDQEVRQLQEEVGRGLSLERIAEIHGRSIYAIECATARMPTFMINGKNYGLLLNDIRRLIRIKIEISARLPI